MIPYISVPPIPMIDDGLAIHPFGIMVAWGIMAGSFLTINHVRRLGLSSHKARNMIFWTLLAGFGFSHIFDVMAYQYNRFTTIGMFMLALLNPRSGLSSMGGFIGAVCGLWAWCRRNDPREMLAYADSLAFGLAPGWAFGRLGCMLAHDHPGIPTKFFLGIDYPCPSTFCAPPQAWISGSSVFRRHDMALYEVLIALLLTLLLFCARPFKPPKGFCLLVIMAFYSPIRFVLDFFRVESNWGADPRYYGLTPAQYIALLFIIIFPFVYRRVMNSSQVEYPSF